MKVCLATLIVLACCAIPLASITRGGSVMSITLDPGDIERQAAPVTATVTLPAEIEKGGLLQLESPGVNPIPAQLQRTADGQAVLRFIEPLAHAHQPKTYQLTLVKGEAAPGFAFVPHDGYRDLTYAGKGVMRYMNSYDEANRADTFKPYHHVFDFAGDDFITKGAGGSFTHHRGLFFGFNKTQYGDFWHCPDVSQRFDHFVSDQEFAGPVAARDVSVVNWVGKEGAPVARDTRGVTVWHISPTQLLMDWTITLEALKDDGLKLDGDPQHAGFHFRAAEEVAQGISGTSGGKATFIRPASAKFTKNDEWLDLTWAACSFTVKGKPYLVVHMDAPSNPRPITYSTRAYGRFGSFFTGQVEKGKPLVLHYRIVVLDAAANPNVTPETLTQMYSDFADPVKVTAK
ncbi:MAG TPA: DUF6807 family protein [Tepidisphaeraceae bacterium]